MLNLSVGNCGKIWILLSSLKSEQKIQSSDLRQYHKAIFVFILNSLQIATKRNINELNYGISVAVCDLSIWTLEGNFLSVCICLWVYWMQTRKCANFGTHMVNTCKFLFLWIGNSRAASEHTLRCVEWRYYDIALYISSLKSLNLWHCLLIDSPQNTWNDGSGFSI